MSRVPRAAPPGGPGQSGPLRVDVADLLGHPGRSRTIEVTALADSPLGTSAVSVDRGTPITVGARIEVLADALWVGGRVQTTALTECSRCLEPLGIAVDAPIEEVFADRPRGGRPPLGQPEQDDDEEEEPAVEGTHIDLTPAVRDAIVLALPRFPLCQPDCPGLCDQCGIRLVDEPGHDHRTVDPRWAGLADFPGGPGMPSPRTGGPAIDPGTIGER